MSWSYSARRKAWVCTSYADLSVGAINDLAEYGQPISPYERGYDHDFVPDMANVNVDMPHREVMVHGYGKDITAESFPVVEWFLDKADHGWFHRGDRLRVATYSFSQLVTHKFCAASDRIITGNVYPWNPWRKPSGSIPTADAAYIHGSVGFALMAGTRFIVGATSRRVEAEIGALDDNWDFDSGNAVAQRLNGVVRVLVGPAHYNLERAIRIRFTGPGKLSAAQK